MTLICQFALNVECTSLSSREVVVITRPIEDCGASSVWTRFAVKTEKVV